MTGIASLGATSMHTTTEAQRAEEPSFPIPDGVFEPGPFAKGLDRGIKLAKVKQ